MLHINVGKDINEINKRLSLAKAKNNFYAVLAGRKPGIYRNWAECQRQVIGFKGAKFKGFVTLEEAEAFMGSRNGSSSAGNGTGCGAGLVGNGMDGGAGDFPKGTVIFVDGSYMKGRYSWGFAAYEDGELVDTRNGAGTSKDAAKLHNVAGEMDAAREAVLWAEAQGLEDTGVTICHDYEGIAAWPLGHWQAKLPQTQEYAAFMQQRLGWVRFQKVAGHTGVEGNELADRLAKEALL